jgi:hypothetical protein
MEIDESHGTGEGRDLVRDPELKVVEPLPLLV